VRKFATTFAVIGMALIPVLNAAPVAAQTGSNPQTFISGDGRDKGICTIDRPCLTLSYTLTQTRAGGDVYIVDTWVSPNENVTITDSVDIHGGGNTANFGAATGTALTINAPSTSPVTLTNLIITNFGTATNGIVFNSGSALNLGHTNVIGFSNVGLTFSPNTSGGNSKLHILRNSAINGNGNGGSGGGILISPAGSTGAHVEIKDATIRNSGMFGVMIDTTAGAAPVNVEIVDSLILHSGTNGILVLAPTNFGFVLVSGTHISHGANGVVANGANAVTLLDNSRIINTNVGVVSIGGGIVASYGNNGITFNSTNNTGILTPQALH
jgi:hypothetical protein